MHTPKRNWLVWLLPLTLCLGIALGALLGMSFTPDSASREGPEGEMAGAHPPIIASCTSSLKYENFSHFPAISAANQTNMHIV
jgi:hypothetical protein